MENNSNIVIPLIPVDDLKKAKKAEEAASKLIAQEVAGLGLKYSKEKVNFDFSKVKI